MITHMPYNYMQMVQGERGIYRKRESGHSKNDNNSGMQLQGVFLLSVVCFLILTSHFSFFLVTIQRYTFNKSQFVSFYGSMVKSEWIWEPNPIHS